MADTIDREAQYQIVYRAICAVAARCDGAINLDDRGFSGVHTHFGRRIAGTPYSEWTDEIKEEAARVSIIYKDQIARYGVIEDIYTLDVVKEAKKQEIAYAQARRLERLRNEKLNRKCFLDNGEVVYSFPFDRDIMDALKASSPAFHFNGIDKTWRVPVGALNREIVAATYRYEFNILDEATEALLSEATDKVVEKLPTGTVELQGEQIKVTLIGKLSSLDFGAYRGLAGYSWVRGSNESFVAPIESNLDWLQSHDFTGDYDGIRAQFAAAFQAAQERTEASRKTSADLDLSHVVPSGLTPYDFQVSAVEYALTTRRCFIADEMGLGKTISAILAVEVANAHPAIVVCPASLKGNWEREISRWAPSRSVTVLSGRTPDPSVLKADYVIVNYDILEAWVESLIASAPQTLVNDESHYAKNPLAKRTRALINLSKSIPQSGLVLCLTGTPIINRPVELLTQLKVLGRLAEIAPTPRQRGDRALEFAFKFRYCSPERNRFGWEFKGASNSAELNEKLRSVCFIRRNRADVLDMKETHRLQVPFSLNGALNDYKRAEDNIIRYISEELGTKAALKAKRAEVLVQMNTLRRLAEEAKIAATIEWVEDWLESYPEKKLVIFAAHVSVQKALADHFSCPTILGGQKDVEGQKKLFQEGTARVIVCSLQAAREGHTLTAASDVVFTSLGWTPGGLQQAEDRCNRIGQQSDKVVAWQLTAAGTVDEEIAKLIAAKRQVFNAVVNGEERDDVDDDILWGAINYLANKADHPKVEGR